MPRAKLSDSDLVLDRLLTLLRQVPPDEIIGKETYTAQAKDYRNRYRYDLVRKAVKELRKEHMVFRTIRGVGLRHIGQPREQFIPLEAAYRSIKNKARDARERLDAAPLDQFSDPVDSQMRWAQSRRLKLIEDAGDTGLHETRRYFKSNPEPPQYPTPKPPADPPRRQYRSNPDLWKPPSQEQ